MTVQGQQQQQQQQQESVNDLKIQPPCAAPKRNLPFSITRAFSSTTSNAGQSTVQVIQYDHLKRYPLRNRGNSTTTSTEIAEETVLEDASTVTATVQKTRQTTTQVIQAAGGAVTQHRYRPKRPPTLDEYIEKLPLVSLPPNYTVITTKSKEEVDRELPVMLSQESVFGFDMEWRPSFRKNVPHSPTGLIQICGASKVLLIQVSQMQGLPKSLIQFLTDSSIFKTGVNIRGDGLKLHRDFQIHTDGLLDLRPIATEALESLPVPHPGSKSLRALAAIFMGMNMPKGRVRCSNWNAAQLSPLQIEYAANDAYASYFLYHTLMDATKMTKSALRPHHLSREKR